MSEKPTFAVGDIVMLKSGGPAMTVVNLGSNVVDCGWFNECVDGWRYDSAGFPHRALVTWTPVREEFFAGQKEVEK